MRRLRLVTPAATVALLAAVLLTIAVVPAAALDTEGPPSAGWTDTLLAWLSAWNPFEAVTGANGASAPAEEPLPSGEPQDPATTTTTEPEGSDGSESGTKMDPDG